jgi:hypothetical protein
VSALTAADTNLMTWGQPNLEPAHFQAITLDQRVALLGQYVASSFVTTGAGQGETLMADPANAPQQTFVTPPQHL